MKNLIFLFVLVIGLTSFKSVSEPQEIYWSKDYNIKVSDFKTVNYLPKGQLAIINTGILMNSNVYHGVYTYAAYATCSRYKSVMLQKVKNGYQTQRVLEHEQIHFDIAEYVVRLLNQKFKGLQEYNKAEEYYYHYYELFQTIQIVYDAQTDHENDPVWQLKWRKRMDELLSKDVLGDDDWKIYP